jgi:hypothetical protein
MVPYLLVLVVGLLIVAFVPWFTVFLPAAFGLGGALRRQAQPSAAIDQPFPLVFRA